MTDLPPFASSLGRKCLLQLNHAEHASSGLDEILSLFVRGCRSQEFASQCAKLGYVDGLLFHTNHWINKDNPPGPGYDKFARYLQEMSPCQQSKTRLGLVFHGTPTHNIAPILKDGLDVSRRKGQLYGPGEYFSITPGTCEDYCHGGLEMLVFVVVLPDHRVHSIPHDFVIVEDHRQHLAIGTLQYKPVGGFGMCQSKKQLRRCAGINEQIKRRGNAAQQLRSNSVSELQMEPTSDLGAQLYPTMLKQQHQSSHDKFQELCCRGSVVQELTLENIDIASEIYRRWYTLLSRSSKEEISWYVLLRLRKEGTSTIQQKFPGLPKPLEVDDVRNLRAESLRHAGEPKAEIYDHLLCPPAAFVVAPAPFVNVPSNCTHITSAGQRAFRLPPMKSPHSTENGTFKSH